MSHHRFYAKSTIVTCLRFLYIISIIKSKFDLFYLFFRRIGPCLTRTIFLVAVLLRDRHFSDDHLYLFYAKRMQRSDSNIELLCSTEKLSIE